MDARIKIQNSKPEDQCKWIEYESVRVHRNEAPAKLSLSYRPIGPVFESEPRSLEEFLTARYCLYSADSGGRIFRGEVEHAPWQLRQAQAIVNENTMTDWLGIELPEDEPVLHFSKTTKVVAWTLDRALP